MLRKRSSSRSKACGCELLLSAITPGTALTPTKHPYLEASLEVTCTKTVSPGIVSESEEVCFQTNFVIYTTYKTFSHTLPAKLMDVSLFVEVVAVLTDVVQLGVDGGIILAMTVFWHSSITLPAIIENVQMKISGILLRLESLAF